MRLGRDEVHVWSVGLTAADRRSRRDEAHHALRRILGTYLCEEPGAIRLRLGEHSKPALAEPRPRLRFNLSHSGNLALIGVTRECEVGLDVEHKDRGRDFARLARRGLDAAQAEEIRSAPARERAAAFYAAWTRREAIAKCHGTGLGTELPPFPVSVRDIEVGDGYAAAVALAVPAALPLRRFAIGSEELRLRNHRLDPLQPERKGTL